MSRCCQPLVLSRKGQSAGQRITVWWIGLEALTSEQLAGVHASREDSRQSAWHFRLKVSTSM